MVRGCNIARIQQVGTVVGCGLCVLSLRHGSLLGVLAVGNLHHLAGPFPIMNLFPLLLGDCNAELWYPGPQANKISTIAFS